MKVDIDLIFDQIVNMQVKDLETVKLKDIQLDLKKEYEYDFSMGYLESYYYLCDCLAIDTANNNSRKLLDLFLVHQYLCYAYLSENVVNNILENPDEIEFIIPIIKECFSVYRFIGNFEACVNEYEILRSSDVWQVFSSIDKMQILKEAAKSYRNMGDFRCALSLYYECLKINPEQDWLQKVELLLKIGKVYRNYLLQIELARFYVEEAYRILIANSSEPYDDEKVWRYAVICFDTLGQIYRDKCDYRKAEIFFEKSKELYGGTGGRARVHKILMKYQSNSSYEEEELKKDIAVLIETIENLEKSVVDEVGIGIRSVQLGKLKFADKTRNKEEAYQEIRKGRHIANKYNDIKTIIRSYMEEADFLKAEGDYEGYRNTNLTAIKIASSNNQLVLENKIIKETIEVSNATNVIDSAMEIELIKRRKNIYMQLVEFSKLSISIVQESMSGFFSQDKLIDMYKIVLEDFEQIFGELNSIIEILDIEFEKLSQKYIAYLNTEIRGFTYKSILHKFKNDLPDSNTINQLILLCNDAQGIQPEERYALQEGTIFQEINKQLGTFANIIEHIKQSANETLKEAEYEKKWCALKELIQNGVQNFVCARPKYEGYIFLKYTEEDVSIMVQRTLFETTILEVLSNAFDYAETVMKPEDMTEKFRFYIMMKIVEERVVLLEFYSGYLSTETAKVAADSIEKGLKHRKSTKRNGSQYGFHSMKLLFEDFMGGKIQVFQREKEAGIRIQLPINLVTLQIEKGKK